MNMFSNSVQTLHYEVKVMHSLIILKITHSLIMQYTFFMRRNSSLKICVQNNLFYPPSFILNTPLTTSYRGKHTRYLDAFHLIF
jgi:hypothetical protein